MNLEMRLQATPENTEAIFSVLREFPFWVDGEYFSFDDGDTQRQQICRFAGNFMFCLDSSDNASRVLSDYVGRQGRNGHLRYHGEQMSEEDILAIYYKLRRAEKTGA